MAASFDLVTFDSPDTERAASFWCAALSLHETQREDDDRWIVLSDEQGVRRIGLQKGVAVPGTVHLDLVCAPDEFTAESERLIALGATMDRPPRHEPYGSIVNLRDPDGNAFDLCAYVDW